MFSTPVAVVLLSVAFFRQLAQHLSRGDRSAIPVGEFQGLVLLAGAMFCLGKGLALLSLSVTALVPLAFGSILLALLIAAYGVRLIRARS